MTFAFRMAWLESRASRSRFVFVILAVALGVAALTGVKGFSESVRYTLYKEARTLMGADLMVRMNSIPTDSDKAFLEALRGSGIDYTFVTETVSMAASGPQSTPILSSVKAIDLSKYPFYGQVEFDPPTREMSADTVVVSEDLLLRLGIQVGDTVKVGAQTFRIVAISRKEPDRMTTGFTLGPRVLMSREGYDRTGLNIFGSRATQRILLRLPVGSDVRAVRRSVRDAIGRRGRVIDYTEANPTLSRNMERATSFLAMVSLIALIVGGVGVATAIESHIRQRMDHIAVMKCLGGQSRRVMQIYAAQAFLLGASGSLIGVVLGFAVQAVFPRFLADYFDLQIDFVISWIPIVQGLAVGLLTALLFTIPPLLSISRIRPALILRRDMQEKHDVRRDFRAWGALAVIAMGVWAIAVWMSASFRIGSYFAVGLVLSIAALAAIARGVMGLLRRAVKRYSILLSPILRQGMANLYRPGTHTTAILIALGVGVMFTLTVQLLQGSLLEQLRLSAPPDSPNVFLINVTERDREGLWRLMRSQRGALDVPDAFPAVAAQLSSIGGTPVEQIELSEGERRYFRTQFALTWSEQIPKATEVLAGSWWTPGTPENLVSVEQDAADSLRLKVGDMVEWNVTGKLLSARVASIRRTDAARLGAGNQFILTRFALAKFPVIYYGAIRMRPDAVSDLQRVVFEQYPAVTVVNAADVLEIVQGVVDRISLTVRFLSAFAIFGGAIILASAVIGTRYRRMREVAILKTVGATRWKIVSIFSIEFMIIGAVAGMVGSSLSALFSLIVVQRLFHAVYVIPILPVLTSVVLTAAIAVIAGWAASFGILDRKPLEVLRQAGA